MDLSSELLVRNAFVRRALAYDQSGLLTFTVQMHWVDSLFKKLHLPNMLNYGSITMSQCLGADQELWMLLSEKLRGHISPVIGAGKKPLDDNFKELCLDHSVVFLLLPTPKSTRKPDEPDKSFKAPAKGPQKGSNKVVKDAGNKNAGKKTEASVPDELKNYAIKTPDGKYICWSYSRGCKFADKKNLRCRRGVHVCMKCFGQHSVSSGSC